MDAVGGCRLAITPKGTHWNRHAQPGPFCLLSEALRAQVKRRFGPLWKRRVAQQRLDEYRLGKAPGVPMKEQPHGERAQPVAQVVAGAEGRAGDGTWLAEAGMHWLRRIECF